MSVPHPPHKLLIVSHSQSGATRAMAEAVLRGATSELVDNVGVRSLDALEATAEDVLWADALILGTPENFGYMSGAMKYFLDRMYHACIERIDGKPYALFIRAGNDGTGAISSLRRILTGLAVREVQQPVLIVGDYGDEELARCEELGMTMAAGLEAGVF